jgi:hypothetical protein
MCPYFSQYYPVKVDQSEPYYKPERASGNLDWIFAHNKVDMSSARRAYFARTAVFWDAGIASPGQERRVRNDSTIIKELC